MCNATAPLVGHNICRAAAHRGASSRPPGPVRTPAVREPMGDRAALERVVLELRGGGQRNQLAIVNGPPEEMGL